MSGRRSGRDKLQGKSGPWNISVGILLIFMGGKVLVWVKNVLVLLLDECVNSTWCTLTQEPTEPY